MQAAETVIRRQIEAELAQPGTPGVEAAVAELHRRHGDAIVGILFYGSCLRDGQDEGRLIDLYVLVRRYRDFHPSALKAALNRLVPPNVYYLETGAGGRTVRAKYAVLSLGDLSRGTRRSSLQCSIWGRFSQPCALVYCAAPDVRDVVLEALTSAVFTMMLETLPLVPRDAGPEEIWRRALRESYGTEFRAERGNRPADLYAAYRDRYDRFASAVTAAASVGCRTASGGIFDEAARRRCLRRWRLRRVVGRSLHVARLVKATFTFAGGLDYILWKIESHSGVRTEPTPWQRRHPLLASPLLAYRLYRRGAFR